MNQVVEIDGVQVLLYKSEVDGVICVQVDTKEHEIPETARGPAIRIYLNDDDLYEGVEFP